MKKTLLLFIAAFFTFGANAQIDKTQLSLDVSKKYADNLKLHTQYTWKRSVEAYMDKDLIMSSLSSVTISPDGKMTANVIQEQSNMKKKPGLRGAMQDNAASDMNAYIKNAIELTMKYIFPSQGQMVDLFNKGTLSLLDNNTLQAEAFNLLTQGDRLNYKYNKATLDCLSQDIGTVMNGDPVKAMVSYENVDGLNRVKSVELTLPAKNIVIKLANSEYAKKL
jgi:hypothetical protein